MEALSAVWTLIALVFAFNSVGILMMEEDI